MIGKRYVIDVDKSATGHSELGLAWSCMTDPTTPIRLNVSSFLPEGIDLADVAPRVVLDALISVFALPFKRTPPVPLNIPLDRVPPSKREAIVQDYEKNRPGKKRGSWR